MADDYDIFMRKHPGDYFDWMTFLVAILLVAMGLISIYSATYESNMSSYFDKQLIAIGIGFLVMLGIFFLPEKFLDFNSYNIYGTSVALLVLVLIIGTEVFGTKGWIRVGGFSLQPAELAKIGVLFAVAKFLAGKGKDIRSIRELGIVLAIVAVPIFLVLRQPDLGTATVLVALLFGLLFWTGFDSFILYFFVSMPVLVLASLKGQAYFIGAVTGLSGFSFLFRKKMILTSAAIIVFVVVGLASPVIYGNLQAHQKARIDTFLNPGSNPRGTGYNVIQSMLAVGSGGLSGKGFLQGTQTQLRYIPMQWTDFIYSVPTEEFGFMGGAIVILLYGTLIFRAVKIASETQSKFYSILSIGAATIFLYHCLVNIGMAIGLMPVMGIPLPLMSYGGTSMIVNLALVGILLNAYRHKNIR